MIKHHAVHIRETDDHNNHYLMLNYYIDAYNTPDSDMTAGYSNI